MGDIGSSAGENGSSAENDNTGNIGSSAGENGSSTENDNTGNTENGIASSDDLDNSAWETNNGIGEACVEDIDSIGERYASSNGGHMNNVVGRGSNDAVRLVDGDGTNDLDLQVIDTHTHNIADSSTVNGAQDAENSVDIFQHPVEGLSASELSVVQFGGNLDNAQNLPQELEFIT
ncbi:hypothetical protein M0R45_017440 [Rubus argutus]|uniref:Uncharacterized protein n=1 Tax=Rubus argutus TaxID=59490 RepID=A0AAW1XY27_RUBAR